jgi:hypothetical protein
MPTPLQELPLFPHAGAATLHFGDEEFQFDPPPSEELLPTIHQICALGALQNNWDSYGARPIESSIARAAIEFLVDALPPHAPLPTVVPTSWGGIQLEWHCRGVDLEIAVRSPERFQVSFEDFVSGAAESTTIGEDFRPLQPLLQRLVERA